MQGRRVVAPDVERQHLDTGRIGCRYEGTGQRTAHAPALGMRRNGHPPHVGVLAVRRAFITGPVAQPDESARRRPSGAGDRANGGQPTGRDGGLGNGDVRGT